MKTPIPHDEKARMETLRQYQILDTAAEDAFDDITNLAAEICGTPISLITLVDGDRQWFKSKVGVTLQETNRDIAFCAHAICQDDLFVVPDALADDRFSRNPLVTHDPNIRFYAGMPLYVRNGYPLGTLCVIDREPRHLTDEQKDKLRALAASVVMLLEIRRK
jgi:GAF domain-containing protein